LKKYFSFKDFLKNGAQKWWKQLITNFDQVNLSFDGLWIDMNEPGNFYIIEK
jgi:alpha-glucosidase (family GH31 glycosyl hydrolase)